MKKSKTKQINHLKQKISEMKCPIHVKKAIYTSGINNIIQQQDCPITFSEYLNRVHYELSSSYRHSNIEAKELMQREIDTLLDLYKSINKDKIDTGISCTAYTLDLMW